MLKSTTLAIFACTLALGLHAQTYYLMSQMTNGESGPPYPFNPCETCSVSSEGGGIFWVDDRDASGGSLFSFSMTTSDDLSPPGSDTNETSTNFSSNLFEADYSYQTNGSLWIEASVADITNISLRIHNTTNALFYQIWSSTNLTFQQSNWMSGEFKREIRRRT